jgi:hypothetical protein
MQVDNFSVMEIRPVSEPIMQFLSACNRFQAIRQSHLRILHPRSSMLCQRSWRKQAWVLKKEPKQ